MIAKDIMWINGDLPSMFLYVNVVQRCHTPQMYLLPPQHKNFVKVDNDKQYNIKEKYSRPINMPKEG